MPEIIFEYFIGLNNRKYFYSLRKVKKGVTFFECKAANISQEFLNEDIPNLLMDLPNLILAEQNYGKDQKDIIRFRINASDKAKILKKALNKGYSTVSEYLRDVALGE